MIDYHSTIKIYNLNYYIIAINKNLTFLTSNMKRKTLDIAKYLKLQAELNTEKKSMRC